MVLSAVGKVKYSGPSEMKEYEKSGKTKTSLMRPCLFSDGTKTVSLSLWEDFVHLVQSCEFRSAFGSADLKADLKWPKPT